MKLFTIILFLFSSLSVMAFTNTPEKFSIGLGNLTEHVGKIQTDIDGGYNYFEFNPVIKGAYRNDFYWGKDYVVELGLSIPRSGEDSAVTITNFWTNFLIEHRWNDFRFHGGLGFFFTYINMDGQTQYLNNGGTTVPFATPDELVTTINYTAVLGADYIFNRNWYLNTQFDIFNLTDSDKRSFSYLLSINYTFDKKKKPKAAKKKRYKSKRRKY